MRRVPKIQMTAASALLIGIVALAGCAPSSPEPSPTAAPTDTATPDPTATSPDSALPPQDIPQTSDGALAEATALIEEYEPVHLRLSTEAAPVDITTPYIVEGSQAAQVVADTVRMNAEMNAALEGDGQFRWMTFYQGSYAAPLEDLVTGEILEYGVAYIQGCLYNEGLTWVQDGKPMEGVSTDPSRWQYTLIYDVQDSRWKISVMDSLPEATFPC